MNSEKRSQAARANGARSRGSVTPEGKATSSRNAMRHGLLAKTLVLSNEDAKTFEHFFNLLIERFSPVNDIEMSTIEEMAAAHWRQRCVMSMERAILEQAILQTPGKGSAEQLAAAFSDPANQATLALLQRYEARFQYMYNRALRSLADLRELPARTPEPPVVSTTEPLPPADPTPDPEPLTPSDLDFLPLGGFAFR